MIQTFRCIFGTPLDISLGDAHEHRVEIEAISFLDKAPSRWRILPDEWKPGSRPGVQGNMRFFHDLHRSVPCKVTGGLKPAGMPCKTAFLETAGEGETTILLHIRPGTYRTTGPGHQVRSRLAGDAPQNSKL